MSTLQLIIIAAGAVLVVVLLALLVNLFKALTRLALAVGAVLVLLGLAAVALSFVTWPEVPTVEIVHLDGDAPPERPTAPPRPSAAVAVRRFLAGVIVVGAVATGGVVIGRHLWQEHKRRTRLQEALTQAQVYALVSGERPFTGQPRRLPQGGGNVILVGGQQGTPSPTTLPDDGQGWEVVQ